MSMPLRPRNEKTSFQTLGERMDQGGKQSHDNSTTLPPLMEQGSAYSQKYKQETLGRRMEQR
jgi:hypothetical protein